MNTQELKLVKYLLERIKEQEEIIHNLTREATRDNLTNLYNRSYYQTVRPDSEMVVLIIDIDFLKSINDEYGHHFGDIAIQTVANVIQKNCRRVDAPIRHGGEEFVLLLNGCNLENAYQIAEKIRKEIEVQTIKFKENEISITVTIGVASKRKDDNLENVIDEADQALYDGKRNGRNQVIVYPDIDKKNTKK